MLLICTNILLYEKALSNMVRLMGSFPWKPMLCRNLSFGSWPSKGVTRLRVKRKPKSQSKEAVRVRTKRKPMSHITYSRECKKVWRSVREWTLTLPRQLPFWEMESRWTPKTSESDFRGQNSMACGVLYIIRKLLELRCLKSARLAHSDIWSTSYGQKKAGSQIGSLIPD